jgi:uncharacterized protein (TIGR02246 family)
MQAHTPEEVHQLFAKFYNAGDLDGLLSIYEPDATFLPQPGQPPVTGTAAISEALKGFLALKGQFKFESTKLIPANDVALLFSKWTLKGTDPKGNPVELSGQTSDVVRRQAYGNWLILIDNPFGAAGVGA